MPPSEARFAVSIPYSSPSGDQGHTIYSIDVVEDSLGLAYTVGRRFSEFDALRERLMLEADEAPLTSSFPAKKWFWNMAPEVVEDRRLQLEIWLQEAFLLFAEGVQARGAQTELERELLEFIDAPARLEQVEAERRAAKLRRAWVKMQRPAANHPRAAEQAERPWTAERFEVLSEGRSVRVIGNTTGALQMSVPLENELRRTAMDYVSRQAVRRKAAARKRLGLRLQQSTVPQQGVAFGSTVGGSMRWTAQRSSNSRCSISSLASSSQGSVGLRSPRRAATPDGGLAGQATTLPGPSAGWFLPLSPHSDAESSPGRDSLRSRGSVVSSNATVECELLDKRPVLIQASQPQLSARTGRQSPRHGASVRYVKSPREKRQGTGRDPSRSHLSGKGVVSRNEQYLVLTRLFAGLSTA